MAPRETSGGYSCNNISWSLTVLLSCITDIITSMFWTLAMNNQSNDKLKNYIQHDRERKNRKKSFCLQKHD